MSAYFQVDANPESKSPTRRGNQKQRRRRFTLEHKRGIVQESMKPGASVSRIARDHDVNTNQVFKWRRLYEQGLLGVRRKSVPMLPVKVEEPSTWAGGIVVHAPAVEVKPQRGTRSGSIEIELSGGRIMVQGAVDRAALRMVIKLLSR